MFSEEEELEIGAKLHEVVASMIGRDLRDGALNFDERICPFDIRRQNIHDSKADFAAELTLVREWLGQFEKLSEVLYRENSDSSDNDNMLDLVEFLNAHARSDSKYFEPKTAQELAVSNVMRCGFISCILTLNQHLERFLESRLVALEQQEKEYWTVAHRPPNYYARTIALRLAKVFARETGSYPTIGTASYNNQPSTKYARALESTFQILSIEADVLGPGEWAISQLGEEDLVAPTRYGSRSSMQIKSSIEIIREISEKGYLKKGPEKKGL